MVASPVSCFVSCTHLEGDDGRGSPRPLGVLDDSRRPALHDGHAGVRRPEIDADDVAGGALGGEGAPRGRGGGRAYRGGRGCGGTSADLRQLSLFGILLFGGKQDADARNTQQRGRSGKSIGVALGITSRVFYYGRVQKREGCRSKSKRLEKHTHRLLLNPRKCNITKTSRSLWRRKNSGSEMPPVGTGFWSCESTRNQLREAGCHAATPKCRAKAHAAQRTSPSFQTFCVDREPACAPCALTMQHAVEESPP